MSSYRPTISHRPNISHRLIDIFGRDSPRPDNNSIIALFIFNGREFHVFVGRYSSNASGSFILSGCNIDPDGTVHPSEPAYYSPPKILKLFTEQTTDIRTILHYDTSTHPLGRSLTQNELVLSDLPSGTSSIIVDNLGKKYYWVNYTNLTDLNSLSNNAYTLIGGRKRKSKRRRSKRRRSIKY